MSTRGKVSKFRLLKSLTLQRFFSAFSAFFCIQSLSEFMSTYRAHCIMGRLSQKPSLFPGPFLGGKESTLCVSRSPPNLVPRVLSLPPSRKYFLEGGRERTLGTRLAPPPPFPGPPTLEACSQLQNVVKDKYV